MVMESQTTEFLPPAAVAVATFPHLQHQAERALTAQLRRISERCSLFLPRPVESDALTAAARDSSGGIVALECPPGSGATALLCHLAATRRWAFWLPEDDAGDGPVALCAQVLALGDLAVPLVTPTARCDATVIEQVLTEAGRARPAGDPLVVLVGRMPDDTLVQTPRLFPQAIPPGVVIVIATAPGMALPVPATIAVTRLRLTASEAFLADVAARRGCSRSLALALAERSEGLLLYIRLASGLLATRVLEPRRLPRGVADLHQRWWDGLDPRARTLATVLAAAAEPLPLALAAELAGLTEDAARHTLHRWGPLIERAGNEVWLYHQVTRAYIGAAASNGLAAAHAAFVILAQHRSGGAPERSGWSDEHALSRGLARHIALSNGTPLSGARFIMDRAWIRAQERRSGDLRSAAEDALWTLRAAAGGGSLLDLVRAAALAGTLALLGRSLPPRAPAAAFATAVDRGHPRDTMLRRVRAMVDQLPDGHDKALALRQLGEVSYALRMRAPAMRMLSEALDLEAPGPTRRWLDQREEALVALARAAISIDSPDTALGITTRIVHTERRGMIETEVVRWLIAHERRGRAEEVAYAIGHAGNHEWAMAEVAVGHARAGDYERAALVLDTLRTDTAIAWVTAELACDAARRGNPRAADRVALLPDPVLRDRALAQTARALIAQVAPEIALEAARMIDAHDARARCLIDMALEHPPVAFQALDAAATAAIAVEGEERVSLIAVLAAAEAASGRVDAGMRMAALLPEGEERDRAHSRIAVALARRGDYAGAEAVVYAIADDDERGWALEELARILAAEGRYREAFALAAQIGDDVERAQLEADLVIAWARSGEAAAAYARAEQIPLAAARARAQAALALPLVAAGARARAFLGVAELMAPDTGSRYLLAAAQALAAHGLADDALHVTARIARPLERARALVATARALAGNGAALRAQELLGAALLTIAPSGRNETLQCLGWAADTLAVLGGSELLLAAAAALDEIDGWLSNG